MRNLRPGEKHPEGLETGFEKLNLMPEWCWIAQRDSGEAVGMLVGAPCHGLVYMMRMRVKDGEANKAVPLALLRAFLRDCKERGFLAYFTHLDPTREIEQRLIGLVRQAGGVQVTCPQVAVVGFVAEAARY